MANPACSISMTASKSLRVETSSQLSVEIAPVHPTILERPFFPRVVRSWCRRRTLGGCLSRFRGTEQTRLVFPQMARVRQIWVAPLVRTGLALGVFARHGTGRGKPSPYEPRSLVDPPRRAPDPKKSAVPGIETAPSCQIQPPLVIHDAEGLCSPHVNSVTGEHLWPATPTQAPPRNRRSGLCRWFVHKTVGRGH
jgi:hypothetical protein